VQYSGSVDLAEPLAPLAITELVRDYWQRRPLDIRVHRQAGRSARPRGVRSRGRPSPGALQLQRAEIACAALEGVVRSVIEDDPDRLRDPSWIEQVVRMAVRTVAE
jgi:hypothetical protein